MVIRLQRLPPPTSHRHCTLEFGICRRRSFRSSWQQLGTSSKRLGTNMFDFGMIERDFEGFNNVLTTPRDEYIVDHHRSRKCFLQLAACCVLRSAFLLLAPPILAVLALLVAQEDSLSGRDDHVQARIDEHQQQHINNKQTKRSTCSNNENNHQLSHQTLCRQPPPTDYSHTPRKAPTTSRYDTGTHSPRPDLCLCQSRHARGGTTSLCCLARTVSAAAQARRRVGIGREAETTDRGSADTGAASQASEMRSYGWKHCYDCSWLTVGSMQ